MGRREGGRLRGRKGSPVFSPHAVGNPINHTVSKQKNEFTQNENINTITGSNAIQTMTRLEKHNNRLSRF